MRPFVLRYSFMLLLLALTLSGFGQSDPDPTGPYHLSLRRELLFGGAAAASLGGGYLIDAGIDAVRLSTVDLWKVPAFDCGPVRFASFQARQASDKAVYAAVDAV